MDKTKKLIKVILIIALVFWGVQDAKASWDIQTVDDSVGVNEPYSSMAIDSNNNIHIVYTNSSFASNGDLEYAYSDDNGATWDIKRIDGMGGGGGDTNTAVYPSIAVDSSGGIHISYLYKSPLETGDLMYAYSNDNGNTWSIRIAHASDEIVTGIFSSISLDFSNGIHISHQSGGLGNDDQKYAYSDDGGATWDLRTVPDGGRVYGSYSSSDLDSLGNIHISFTDATDSEPNLLHATWDGSSWQTTTVDNSSLFLHYTSIDVDDSDNIHISYVMDGDLKYAYSSDGGSSWTEVVVDNDIGYFDPTSISN